MKFITNSFSNDMWQEPNNFLIECELSEEQFKEEIIGGRSFVSREDVAEHLGVPLNPRPVKARPGDEIYNVVWKPTGFVYYCITVMDAEFGDKLIELTEYINNRFSEALGVVLTESDVMELTFKFFFDNYSQEEIIDMLKEYKARGEVYGYC